MDLSKYNKGLPLLATLFNLNPDVFNTNTFIDIYTKCDKYSAFENSIFLVYSLELRDQYIIHLLKKNKYFFKVDIINIENKYMCVYIFTIDNTKVTTYSEITKVGSTMLGKDFITRLCITWKKYLDDYFYKYLNVWTCEQCLQTKARIQVLAFLF